MKHKITARCQITVELDLSLENWNESSTIDQVYREGSERATARITDLCQRYVRLIGKPKVEAIMSVKE